MADHDTHDHTGVTGFPAAMSTVSHAEVEAGVATTVRGWTAERITQPIAALASAGRWRRRLSRGDSRHAGDNVIWSGGNSPNGLHVTTQIIITGLSPGSHTFRVAHRTNGGGRTKVLSVAGKVTMSIYELP